MLKALRKIRKEHHLTIYDMACKLNITPSFYSQIENERRRLYYDTAVKISIIFRKTPYELFGIKEKIR